MEGLKIVVGADTKQAEDALKKFATTAGKTGTVAGNQFSSGLNKANTALSKLPSSANQATAAMTNLSRVVQDAPFGFLGIANNLNPLLESFQRLKASTGTTGGAFKALAKSIGGAGGIGFAVSLASSALVLFGDKLFGGGQKAKEANDKLKELIRSVKDISAEAAAGTAGESAKVSALVGVIENQTNSYEKRNNALKELQSINKNYFGDLTLEASHLKLLRERADEYTKALVQQAVIKAFQDEIGKVSVELAKQNKELGEAARLYNKMAKAAKAPIGSEVKKQFGIAEDQVLLQQQATVKAADAFNDLAGQVGVVNKLKTQFADLNKALNEAVVLSLSFKPLDDDTSKKSLDDIVSRAKKIAEFLDKTTQFNVFFEVNPLDSEQETNRKAREFINKVQKFIDTGLPPFSFKNLFRTELAFIPDAKFFQDIREQAGIIGTRTFKEVKKAFEDNIELAAKNSPAIQVQARIQAGIKAESLNRSELASGLGLKIPGVNEAVSTLTAIQKQSIVAANTITGILTPAFQDLFAAIKAGENPLKAFFESLGQSVVQLIQKLIAAAIQAAILSAIFPGGVGGVKGFGGFFKNILGFAQGGLVMGPTLSLIGEGLGTSRSNPEVVAPLDKLQAMLAGIVGGKSSQMQPVVLQARLKGNDIVLSNSRTGKRNRRSGA